jgi:hypothetical protein
MGADSGLLGPALVFVVCHVQHPETTSTLEQSCCALTKQHDLSSLPSCNGSCLLRTTLLNAEQAVNDILAAFCSFASSHAERS